MLPVLCIKQAVISLGPTENIPCAFDDMTNHRVVFVVFIKMVHKYLCKKNDFMYFKQFGYFKVFVIKSIMNTFEFCAQCFENYLHDL